MARVVVTGANGFVGRHLVRLLQDRGYDVVAAVRRPDAVDCLQGIADVEVVGDLRDTQWSAVLRKADFVVHLAAHVHQRQGHGSAGSEGYHEVNVLATQRLAVAAAATGVRRMVFLSSVKAVGEGDFDPDRVYTESDACGPRTAYGRSKRDAEGVLREIAETGRLKVTALRPPLVYGPGVKANFLSLLKAVDRGLPLPFALVHNRRSLLFVGNLVDVIERSLHDGENRQAVETFFVADSEALSTQELVTRIARSLGRRARLIPCPVSLLQAVAWIIGKQQSVASLLGSFTVSTKAIRAVLGWRPPFSTDEGLIQTVAWYRSGSTHRSQAASNDLSLIG